MNNENERSSKKDKDISLEKFGSVRSLLYTFCKGIAATIPHICYMLYKVRCLGTLKSIPLH